MNRIKYLKISASLGFVCLGLFSFTRAWAAPVISGLQATNITATSTVVTWITDIPATSNLVFNTPTLFNIRLPGPLDSTLVTNHSITANNLVPGTTYTYFVASVDGLGNMTSTQASTTTFTTLAVNTSNPPDFRVDTNGGHTVYAGSDLYYAFTATTLSGSIGGWYYPAYSITGIDSSISSLAICMGNDPTNEASDYTLVGGKQACGGGGGTLRLRTSSTTPTGTYTATITFRANTLDRTYTYAFTVLPAPSPIVKQTVSSIPPIPNLAQWQNQMTGVGGLFCDGSAVYFISPYGETQVWYYDGGRVFLQMSDYTHNPTAWLPCAENVLKQYAVAIINNNGAKGNWEVFPAGMAMNYWRYGDNTSKQGVIALYNQANTGTMYGSGPTFGNLTNGGATRPLAYTIDSYIFGEEVGQPRSPYLAEAVDGALSMFDQNFNSNPWQYDDPWMDGLLAESLIRYYNLTGDPRIPPVVKTMLDWVWNNAVDHTTGRVIYQLLDMPPVMFANLTNLVAPTYAWYWNVSGDPTYLTEGDLLFSHALDDDISYAGKSFSQNYTWSFDYVRWRSGNPTMTTDMGDPANARVASSDPAITPSIFSFAASTTTIISGHSVDLSWGTSNAASLSIDNGIGSVTNTLGKTIFPATTTTYTLTATNSAGNSTAQVTVVVNPPAPVISSFSALHPSLTAGQTNTLSWNVSNAATLSIDHGIGIVTGNSVTVSSTVTTTYTLTATNITGTATAQTTVTISAPGSPTITSFSASPSVITIGQSSTLSWSASNAISFSVNNGIGTVTGNSVTVSPTSDTTYTLTATNSNGSVTALIMILVNAPNPIISSFSASPSSIAIGQTSTLSWSVSNTVSLSIDNSIGTVTGNSVTVSPTSDTTYTLTALNGRIRTTAQITIPVESYPALSNVQAGSITSSAATITWNTSQPADSQVNYGLTAGYGLSTDVTDLSPMASAHTIALSNLNPSTLYHFQVQSKNAYGLSGSSADLSFTTPTASGNSGGGGSFSNTPTTVTVAPAASPSITSSATTAPLTSGGILRLINQNGTFYLVINNVKHGITNPGMLASYGFTFSQAEPATSADASLPQGSLLSPQNGSLVKSPKDSTVYLIVNQQRYGFVSAKIFTSLGFKFSSVLTVTDPELQILPKSANLDSSLVSHPPGVEIIHNKTIYLIGDDNQLHPYPSLKVYNSWHIANDFSGIVPSNQADMLLPVGDMLSQRILQ